MCEPKFTPGPWKAIWHGNEKYPYPLSLHTKDDRSWIARDGTVSSYANASLLESAPDLYRELTKTVDALRHERKVLHQSVSTADGRVPDEADGAELAEFDRIIANAEATLARARGEPS